MARRQIRKRKEKKNIEFGVAHIQSTFTWSSAGAQVFKGSRKSTPFAAQQAADVAAKEAMVHGLKQVECLVKGPGSGREAAIRAVQSAGFEISMIKDVTPIPHTGCRPPKRRRV